MDSKTTIVIPCYNQAHWLEDAILSALNQTVPCDVIVVDDGSSDKTTDAAKSYPITVIYQQNKGLSAARNTGIRQAKTEFILPLDADDMIAPDMVEKCLSVQADIVGTAQRTFGDYEVEHIFQPNPRFRDFEQSNQINCCSLFRKHMWEDIKGYDENMRDGYEDWDFWLRATSKGYKVQTIPEFLFFYRKHGQSMVDHATNKHQEIYSYMLNKHKQ